MSRKTSQITGWMLIVVAVLCGTLTVPIWNGRGNGTGGFHDGEFQPAPNNYYRGRAVYL